MLKQVFRFFYLISVYLYITTFIYLRIVLFLVFFVCIKRFYLNFTYDGITVFMHKPYSRLSSEIQNAIFVYNMRLVVLFGLKSFNYLKGFEDNSISKRSLLKVRSFEWNLLPENKYKYDFLQTLVGNDLLRKMWLQWLIFYFIVKLSLEELNVIFFYFYSLNRLNAFSLKCYQISDFNIKCKSKFERAFYVASWLAEELYNEDSEFLLDAHNVLPCWFVDFALLLNEAKNLPFTYSDLDVTKFVFYNFFEDFLFSKLVDTFKKNWFYFRFIVYINPNNYELSSTNIKPAIWNICFNFVLNDFMECSYACSEFERNVWASFFPVHPVKPLQLTNLPAIIKTWDPKLIKPIIQSDFVYKLQKKNIDIMGMFWAPSVNTKTVVKEWRHGIIRLNQVNYSMWVENYSVLLRELFVILRAKVFLANIDLRPSNRFYSWYYRSYSTRFEWKRLSKWANAPWIQCDRRAVLQYLINYTTDSIPELWYRQNKYLINTLLSDFHFEKNLISGRSVFKKVFARYLFNCIFSDVNTTFHLLYLFKLFMKFKADGFHYGENEPLRQFIIGLISDQFVQENILEFLKFRDLSNLCAGRTPRLFKSYDRWLEPVHGGLGPNYPGFLIRLCRAQFADYLYNDMLEYIAKKEGKAIFSKIAAFELTDIRKFYTQDQKKKRAQVYGITLCKGDYFSQWSKKSIKIKHNSTFLLKIKKKRKV